MENRTQVRARFKLGHYRPFWSDGRQSGGYGKVLINASALPDARSRRVVNGGEELCARPVKPFGRGRPWLRWTRALCKFNGGKARR